MTYHTLEHMILEAAEMVRPPERLTVSELAERYRFLNNLGSYVGYWQNKTTPYLVEPMDVLTSTEFTGMVFAGPARTGKALPLDTPIPTPRGWSTMGALREGDEVLDEQGRSCVVRLTTNVMMLHECFRIAFDDGTSIIADAGHKWAVETLWGGNKIVTTAEIASDHQVVKPSGLARSRYAIPMAKPLALPPADLPLDPYTLGVWLGDGSNHSGYLTLNIPDSKVICERIERAGYTTTKYEPRNNCHCVYVSIDGSPLKHTLFEMDIGAKANGKFIPAEYLRASEEQRRELLRGLMDTDGTVDGRQPRAEIAVSDEPLAKGIRELLWSLGIKHSFGVRIPKFSYKDEKREGRPNYRIAFTHYDPPQVFSLPRQIEKMRSTAKPKPSQIDRRWIRKVEPVPSVPVRCIQVDSPSHLFLAGDQMVPTHNSDMFFNYLTHSAICDPADMMVIHMTQATARDWSLGDLERVFRHSKEVRSRLAPGKQSRNVHDVSFASGMRLLVKWPTITELSGKTIPRLWLMDYDRMTQDVDGEGAPFDLARKRATTFRRFGMCAAESSPGFEVENAKWLSRSPHEAPPHEAPPTKGILALYNRGDRRRWYWRCVSCQHSFEPDFKLLTWPNSADFMEAAEQVTLPCPHCGQIYSHAADRTLGVPGKDELNQEHARWLKDGELWTPDGIIGTPARSDIASFWLKGVAAAFTDWRGLVLKYLQAMEEYDNTGSEEALKVTTNTDQGLPYTPKAMQSDRLPEELKARALDWGGSKEDPAVPAGVRFLVATVDVQARSFVVQVHGFGEGGDVWIVDMFKIRKSERLDEDGHPHVLDPASYAEDWHTLIPNVIDRTYPLADGSGRRMQVKMVGCDSGGREGVTANAYNFWRDLRMSNPEQSRRFRLVKGESKPAQPRVRESYPDFNRKDRHAGARGDVPVLFINSDLMKDQSAAMLGRTEPGGGMVNFPIWAEDWLYAQLTTEVRTAKGWVNPKGRRNEAWDLLYYAMALAVFQPIRLERIDWGDPPGWAAEWDKNDLVVAVGVTKNFDNHPKVENNLRSLAESLA